MQGGIADSITFILDVMTNKFYNWSEHSRHSTVVDILYNPYVTYSSHINGSIFYYDCTKLRGTGSLERLTNTCVAFGQY